MVSMEQSCQEPAFCLQPGMAINQLQNNTEDMGTPATQPRLQEVTPEWLLYQSGCCARARCPGGGSPGAALLLIRTEVQPCLAKTEQRAVSGTPPAVGGLLGRVAGGVRQLVHPRVFEKPL